ncbi:DNA mismatch repair protein MutL [Fusobacterium animalis ATCC 51191]|uniref:DNA mismatch repair protein MutL n=1 Tax=Fusobacterium animalis ATCC 51191 TaxID=997347 RepID=F9EP48_9FUSO|nr:DNA mismatch repair protein MutL [Fusobacterium animalis ATCC 51191]
MNNRIETSKKNLESNFNPNEVKENVETFNNSSSNSDFVDRQKTNIENRANKFEGNKLNSNEIKDKYIFDTEDTSRGKIFDDFSSLKNIDFKVIGQVFDTFILVERNGLLEIYDQHIIHERILYEKLKQEYYNHSMSKQNLLVPIRFELDPREKQLALENIEIFSSFGFDIDDFDKNEILLRSIPTMNLRDSYENIIREILDNISKNKDVDIRENIIVSMSCKGAIKANHKLTLEEMYSMVAKLHEVGEYTCPHGRPIIVKMSLLDLEKLFKRK